MFDFLFAALPWASIALLPAVFFARSTYQKKKEEKCDDYGVEGMCPGMCFAWVLRSYEQGKPKKEMPVPH